MIYFRLFIFVVIILISYYYDYVIRKSILFINNFEIVLYYCTEMINVILMEVEFNNDF